MKTVYLKDGRMADLVTKTDKGYLVDPYITWNDDGGDPDSAPSGNIELVAEVFATAPVDLIEADYKKVLERCEQTKKDLEESRKELVKLNGEVSTLQRTKTDLSKMIFNRADFKNAKRLILFEKDKIAPFVVDHDGGRSFKINFSYSMTNWETNERVWSYEMSWGDHWSNGQIYDAEYGLMFDLTDDQIMQLTHERQRKKGVKGFPEHAINSASDQWLTPEFLEEKRAIKDRERKIQLEGAEKDFESALKKLEKLREKQLTT